MADIVAKLQVDSSQYDQKLKSAVEQMNKMEQEVRRTGASFAYADKEEVAFVQSLGQMGTQAQSAKQKMREYTDAIASLTATYRAMSDEEKNSEFGKAMAASIDQISAKAAQLKDIMADTNAQIVRQASDTAAFDSLAGGIGVTVSAFQTLNGAMQLFGIEDENAVQAIAKLQAAMAVTNGLTQIQTALQKQSAVMLGVASIQKKALAAAEALDTAAKGKNIVVTKGATAAQAALNAVANANPYILLASAIAAVGVALYAMSVNSKKAQEEEEKRLKTEEEATKKAEESRQAFVNASSEAMNTASRISALQTAYINANSEIEKTGILKQAQSEFKKLGIECNGVSDAQNLLINKGSQIIELLRLQGTVAALSAIRMEKFKQSFNNLLSNGYDVAGAAALAGAGSEVSQLDAQIIKLQGKAQNLSSQLGVGKKSSGGSKSTTPKEKAEEILPEGSIAELKKRISEAEDAFEKATTQSARDSIQKNIDSLKQQLESMKGTKGEPVEIPITFSKQGLSSIKKQIEDELGGAEFGSNDYIIAANKLVDLQTFESLLKHATENGVQLDQEWTESLFKSVKIGANITDESWQLFVEDINKRLEELNLPPIKLDVKTGNIEELEKDLGSLEKNVNGAIGVFGQLGGAMQEIDDPGAKVAGLIMSAIAEVAATFAKSLEGTFTPWDWIAASISGVATMISTISAIKSATSGNYASGGIIGGNSYSGDNMRGVLPNGDLIGLNSGEVVLNAAQQSRLAGHLAGNNPMQNLQLSTEISGTNLRVVLNNDNRSKGGSRGYYANIH